MQQKLLVLLIIMWTAYKDFIGEKAANAALAVSERKWPDFFKEGGLMLMALFVPVIGTALLLMAVNRWKKAILLLVMGLIFVASYRMNHPDNTGGDDIGGKAGKELARERARELYPSVCSLMFRVLIAVSAFTVIDRKHDIHEIETATQNGDHFYMEGAVAVYQFELDLENEVTQEQADHLRDKFQEYGRKFIGDYPMLISPDSGGRSAVEVLAVHPLGHRICIDVVQTTAASIPMIENRRRARAERLNSPTRPTRYVDEDYGEE